MSTGAASAPTSAPKTPRRRSKAKKSGVSVSDLILKIVSSSKERGGVSLVALKKALAANAYDVVKNNSRIKLAVKRLVANGRLIQTKGTGASGSFKIGSKAVKKPKKPKTPKAKRAKKPKRKTAQKPAGAKKSPKRRRRSKVPKKSPEKTDETTAVKKTPRPKRAKRRASKTSRARTTKK